jgi:hypothetical protein
MTAASAEGTEKEQLNFLAIRLGELNNTASQVLIFLSFAIVAAVTFLAVNPGPAAKGAIHWALRWWIGAIFPTVIGILPLKEIRDRDVLWYRALLGPIRADVVGHRLHLVGAIWFFKAV